MSSWSLIINNRGFFILTNTNQTERKQPQHANSCSHGLCSSPIWGWPRACSRSRNPSHTVGISLVSDGSRRSSSSPRLACLMSGLWGRAVTHVLTDPLSCRCLQMCWRTREHQRTCFTARLKRYACLRWKIIHSRFMVVMVTPWVILATNKNRQERRLTHTIKQEITDRRLHNGHDYMITDTQTDA